MSEKTFTETTKRGQSYIYLEAAKGGELPKLVVGLLKAHGFKRDPTPKCASGFICSDNFSNPFEYGHVMAWELGGPNEVENIVPMYAEWQGSQSTTYSSWRNMEVEIGAIVAGKANQFIFAGVVEYANAGSDYMTQANKFKSYDQYFDWNDYRIPTSFKVYVEPVSSEYGKTILKELLDPKGLGTDAAKVRGDIISGYKGKPAYQKTMDHSKLPPQDRDALIVNACALALPEAMRQHESQKDVDMQDNTNELLKMDFGAKSKALDKPTALSWAEAPMSPKHEDEYMFADTYPGEVQKILETDYYVPSTEAAKVSKQMIQKGLYGNVKARDAKLWSKRRKDLLEARKEQWKKWQKDKRFEEWQKKRGFSGPK